MKKLILLAMIAFIGLPSLAKEKEPKFISGSLHLDPALGESAKGIRTLVFFFLDSNNSIYAAKEFTLDEDLIPSKPYKFNIDFRTVSRNLEMRLPKVFNIKVRLDKQRTSPKEQPGDLLGNVNAVSLGSKDIEITLTTIKK